jgi:hypothetical protein
LRLPWQFDNLQLMNEMAQEALQNENDDAGPTTPVQDAFLFG